MSFIEDYEHDTLIDRAVKAYYHSGRRYTIGREHSDAIQDDLGRVWILLSGGLSLAAIYRYLPNGDRLVRIPSQVVEEIEALGNSGVCESPLDAIQKVFKGKNRKHRA
jgi:hypothetical protein